MSVLPQCPLTTTEPNDEVTLIYKSRMSTVRHAEVEVISAPRNADS